MRSSTNRKPLSEALTEITSALDDADAAYAIIGGLALSHHGYVRATYDIDLLVTHVDRAHVALESLGFEPIDQRRELSAWVREHLRVDLLHALRERTRAMVAGAQRAAEPNLPAIVNLEGLIGLKIQAYSDDSTRIRDLSDILELLRRNADRVDWQSVADDFDLFGQADLLAQIRQQLDA